ncbi:hypothetical protein OIC43_37230 [Streptomyces sp. NBC_00825]|uniref:hypothetical protein n=1 Tax=unclassified Streptomyces TaxID=2593676 RepID=UPI002ED1193C|nr:hypothetical protein OG832_06460 [Streptomyces sp. NBC_00826]WTH94281.1 hypothetical protein OIC43_37230 [Streptomyces sp. NBC_00825]WTI03016.1 hypothetical protein OHA23_37210 [Streptomyces sp. NBC_00822]
MTTEDNGALPAAQSSDNDPVVSAGLEIAMKWGTALGGPAKLDVALKALEPQLRRDHKERMTRLEMQRQEAERASLERREERAHRRHLAGLIVGAALAISMLGSGVYVAPDSPWLATLLCGPSLLALAKVFVLRRSDAGDMAAVSRAARTSTNAATQAPPPAPPAI